MEEPKARKFRRPRIVAQYAAQVAQWLREDPTISALQVLRLAQAAGYRGGKSAFYELVRRVRTLDARSGGSRQLVVVAGQVPTLLDNRDRRALDDARERSKWGIAR